MLRKPRKIWQKTKRSASVKAIRHKVIAKNIDKKVKNRIKISKRPKLR